MKHWCGYVNKVALDYTIGGTRESTFLIFYTKRTAGVNRRFSLDERWHIFQKYGSDGKIYFTVYRQQYVNALSAVLILINNLRKS